MRLSKGYLKTDFAHPEHYPITDFFKMLYECYKLFELKLEKSVFIYLFFLIQTSRFASKKISLFYQAKQIFCWSC